MGITQVVEVECRPNAGVDVLFTTLKQRLLLRRLDETPESESHALIIRQADEASFLAWLTTYPLLTFPCLFEERAKTAVGQARQEAGHYWDGLEPGVAACAA